MTYKQMTVVRAFCCLSLPVCLALFALSVWPSVRPSVSACVRLCLCASSSSLCGLARRFFAVSRFVIPLGCARKLIIFDLREKVIGPTLI